MFNLCSSKQGHDPQHLQLISSAQFAQGEYWTIHFYDDGFGVLLNSRYDEWSSEDSDLEDHASKRQAIAIDDVLKYGVYFRAKAGYVIFCNSGQGKGETIKLSQLLARHAEHSLKCTVGDSIKWPTDLSLFQSRWPRQGICFTCNTFIRSM